jgi:hypothetical protein
VGARPRKPSNCGYRADKDIDNERVRLRSVKLSAVTPLNRFRIQQAEGVLFLDGLRRKLGDEAFLKLMKIISRRIRRKPSARNRSWTSAAWCMRLPIRAREQQMC